LEELQQNKANLQIAHQAINTLNQRK